MKTLTLFFAVTAAVAAISDQVQMALIAAISAAIVAIPSIVIALRGTNKKIDDAKVETSTQLKEVSTQLDGRLTKLVEEVSKAKFAEGMLEGLRQGAATASKDKVVDALIAATPKAPLEIATNPLPPPAPVADPPPVEIAGVSMPDKKEP